MHGYVRCYTRRAWPHKAGMRRAADAPESPDTVMLLVGPSLDGGPDRELLLRAIISAACHASPRRMRSSWFAFHSCSTHTTM